MTARSLHRHRRLRSGIMRTAALVGGVVGAIVIAAPPLRAASSPARTVPAAPASVAPGAPPAKAQFGPFDAGAARSVRRHGERGRARRSHPVVGDVAHIPGAGPPPPPLRVDPDVPEAAFDGVNAVEGGLSSNPLYLASLFYSNFLTRTDGPRCQHLPTCSRFASQAVARHGVLGIAMGLDRLLQPSSSSALRLLPEVEWGGALRHYDPLDNYEFWRTERFTGLPVAVPEEPLPLPGSSSSALSSSALSSSAPSSSAPSSSAPSSSAPSSSAPSSSAPSSSAPSSFAPSLAGPPGLGRASTPAPGAGPTAAPDAGAPSSSFPPSSSRSR
jgi:hypothetical protein